MPAAGLLRAEQRQWRCLCDTARSNSSELRAWAHWLTKMTVGMDLGSYLTTAPLRCNVSNGSRRSSASSVSTFITNDGKWTVRAEPSELPSDGCATVGGDVDAAGAGASGNLGLGVAGGSSGGGSSHMHGLEGALMTG